MDLDEVMRLDSSYVFQNYSREKVCFSHGEDEFLYDLEGNRYLDLVAGIAVAALGHGSEVIADTVCEQAKKLHHVSNLYYIREQAGLAKTLAGVLPPPLKRSFFVNSGSEATELALKLAVKYSGKDKIVSAWNSFHGRTSGSLSATGQLKYHSGFGPLLSGAFDFVEYGNPEDLKESVTDRTAAVILEPLQGEGGIVAPVPEFIKTARDLCDEYGCLLIMDEVQTGFGRTGKMFGFEHYDIVPDVITLAKAMGGGFPIGAVVTSDEYMKAIGPGSHGSTFGGNPLACSVANAVINTIVDRKLHGRAAEMGERWISRFRGLAEKIGGIKEVRGMGLMIGLDMGQKAEEFKEFAFENHILVNVCGGTVVRIVPPLIVTEESMEELEQALISFRSP